MISTVMQLESFDPADLDGLCSAGLSVATATGGMGLEQEKTGPPPIA